jgi:hypothetical protein
VICHIHKFREKMDAGRFCLGAGITFFDPSVTEGLADSVDFFGSTWSTIRPQWNPCRPI